MYGKYSILRDTSTTLGGAWGGESDDLLRIICATSFKLKFPLDVIIVPLLLKNLWKRDIMKKICLVDKFHFPVSLRP
jgi:hypothetical protein